MVQSPAEAQDTAVARLLSSAGMPEMGWPVPQLPLPDSLAANASRWVDDDVAVNVPVTVQLPADQQEILTGLGTVAAAGMLSACACPQEPLTSSTVKARSDVADAP